MRHGDVVHQHEVGYAGFRSDILAIGNGMVLAGTDEITQRRPEFLLHLLSEPLGSYLGELPVG